MKKLIFCVAALGVAAMALIGCAGKKGDAKAADRDSTYTNTPNGHAMP